jgi:plastocyanin
MQSWCNQKSPNKNKLFVNNRKDIGGIMLLAITLTSCHSPKEKVLPVKYIIEIKEMRFQPAELAIHAGDTVEWINHDFVDHDVTEEKNKEWSSGRLTNGHSWKSVLKKTSVYFCSIHVVMKGRININE